MIAENTVPHMELTAVCCRSEEAVSWARETLDDKVAVYRSAEELFSHPEGYEAVLIVTPHKTHPELACRAFSMGKHVFCDKPSSASLLDAKRMEQEAKRSGKVFAIMFHQRLYARHRKLRQIIDSGELGKLLRVSLTSSEAYRTRYYHESSPWRSSWAGEGGGALINQGQHPLDLWQWLFGMPKEIYARICFGKYNDFTVDDEAMILMDYEDGLTGSFFMATGEAKGGERLEIFGSRGSVSMVDDTITVTHYDQDSLEYGKTSRCTTDAELGCQTETGQYPTVKEYETMLENFALAVLTGEPLIAPGSEGSKALELANGAYLSAWMGQKVRLPVHLQLYDEKLSEKKYK